MSILLNIITITKDDLEGLKRTVKSTKRIRESHGVEQIIIDSSNEPLKNEIKDFLNSETNILYFWQKPMGRSSAFNYGISFSKAEWTWFLNGGDEIYHELNPDFLIDLLSKNNSDSIIFQLSYKQTAIIPGHPQMWALWPPVLTWIPHPSTIIRRKLFNRYGLFDEKLEIAMDFEFWLRCFINNVVVDLISVPIAEFDETGASNKLNIKTRAETKKVIRKYLWRIIKKWFRNASIIIKSLIN